MPDFPFPPGSTSALLDLSGLDLPPAGTAYPAMPTRPADPASPEQPSTSVSLLDDELMSLGEEGAGPGGGQGGCRSGMSPWEDGVGARPLSQRRSLRLQEVEEFIQALTVSGRGWPASKPTSGKPTTTPRLQ